MTLYLIHLRGSEETLHLGADLDDHDAALVQRIARISEDLASGYEPYMTIEAAPEGDPGECPSCGATGDMACCRGD